MDETGGTPVTKLVGRVGFARCLACFRLFLMSTLITGAPIGITGFVDDRVWFAYAMVWPLLLVLMLYNVFVRGPMYCCDVSVPLTFELSNDSLVLNTWYATIGIWPASAVQSVQVYKTTYTGESLFCNRRSQQRSVNSMHGAQPVLIENMEQLRLQLSPHPFFCSSRHSCTCAFLGAQITGMADPVRLSRDVSHRDGLRELYDLATSVRLFREGQLFVSPGPSQEQATGDHRGASADQIADLSSFQLPFDKTSDSEAVQSSPALCSGTTNNEEVCAICLADMVGGDQVCKLWCAHTVSQ